MPFSFTVIFGLCAAAAGASSEVEEVRVQASPIRVADELTYTPQSVSIEHPAGEAQLGETISKLPGVLVRNVSGYGSATTAITPGALGSGGTAVSIDDIPVVEPTGKGVNFSLFPAALIGTIEHRSPFYAAFDPEAETIPSPGGRINLKTLQPAREGEKPWAASVVAGSGETIEASGAWRPHVAPGGGEWLAGLAAFNTAGNYRFRDPATGNGQQDRANNDSNGVGALVKYRRPHLEVLELFSESDRTNPGPLTAPTRDHEKDAFNLLGASYSDPSALARRDGLFGKLAGSFTRTAVRTSPPPAGVAGADSSDARAFSELAQAGYARRGSDGKPLFTLAADDLHDDLRNDGGVFARNVVGGTATGAVSAAPFRFLPLARAESASDFGAAADGTLSAVYSPRAGQDFTLSYGLTHLYPSITAVSGLKAGGYTLLANPNLAIQRDSRVAISADRASERYTLHAGVFYDLIRDRATYATLADGTNQIVNAASVSVWSAMVDAQAFPVESLVARVSVSVGRAWDRDSGHEMPYKPRVGGMASLGYVISPAMGVSVQEHWIGSRFVSVTGDGKLGSSSQTDLRFDFSLHGAIAYFKISNIFDTAAFENPGFPVPGRGFWLGVTL